MTTTAEDISFVLSGGSGNLDPTLSLGGSPAASPIITNSLNNLFDDVISNETESGGEDYRCIYIFNDGDTAIFNPNLFIYDDYEEGSVIELGIEDRNEVQRITISGDIVTSGSMTLSYEGKEIISTYNVDLGVWATTLKSQLNSLLDGSFKILSEVIVTAQTSSSDTIVFDISFIGRDGKRNHDTIAIASNDFSPAVSVSVTIPQQGAPINSIASTINIETTPPGNIGFFVPTIQSPISLPYLKAGEGFPVWVKRVTVSGSVAVENDGVVLRFTSESLDPNP